MATTATSTLLGRPLWYELLTTDVKAAETFYRTVIGWSSAPFDNAPQPYITFQRGADRAVAGLMAKPDEVNAPPFWSLYVGVPRLEDAAANIQRLGGKPCSPVFQVPTVGRMQKMNDPQAAGFYIYEPETPPDTPDTDAQVGEASWHELMTTDAPAALKFYSEVFAWQPSETMDMGPMGKYYMFNRPHGMIGGMMNMPPEMAGVPPYWQIYFRVPDVDAAAGVITANGGQVIMGPMEVPGGDRVLTAKDPQGAVFGLHSAKTT